MFNKCVTHFLPICRKKKKLWFLKKRLLYDLLLYINRKRRSRPFQIHMSHIRTFFLQTQMIWSASVLSTGEKKSQRHFYFAQDLLLVKIGEIIYSSAIWPTPGLIPVKIQIPHSSLLNILLTLNPYGIAIVIKVSLFLLFWEQCTETMAYRSGGQKFRIFGWNLRFFIPSYRVRSKWQCV